MTPEIFAEWFRRQGQHVVRTASSFWVENAPRVYQSFPYHRVIEPDPVELKELFDTQSAIGLRYSTLPDALVGMASYHTVYTLPNYLLENLSKKARYDVHKGINQFRIEPVSFSCLADDGWPVRQDTLKRQRRTRAENPQWWDCLCRSAVDLPGFEAWAAWRDGRMAASLIAFRCEDCVSILYQQSMSDCLSVGVNNALVYCFSQDVLSRPGNLWLFYGLHSLDAPPSVDEFKFRMGYTAKPVRQRVVFHQALRPFANWASHALLKQARHLLPGNTTLAKAEGMLRFYLHGMRPLDDQDWPSPLRTSDVER